MISNSSNKMTKEVNYDNAVVDSVSLNKPIGSTKYIASCITGFTFASQETYIILKVKLTDIRKG